MTRCRRILPLLIALAPAIAACGPNTAQQPAAIAPSASSTPTEKAAPTGTPYGGPLELRKIDQRDATAVSRAAVRVMWTVDAATDRSQRDAYLRARPLCTSEYAAALAADAAAGAIPTAWTDHRAYAKVDLAPRTPEGDVDEDTPTTAYRGWAITVTPTGRDGWTGTPVHAIAFVALKRPNASTPWRISHVGTN
ncbi:hypothetical protein [Actinomadura sp. NPDC048394]|uniref:hypothetical protein n=1 Tax=Actinomadura sp. NPDC048394 TaxID=3158223 RepID=UPI0033C13F10